MIVNPIDYMIILVLDDIDKVMVRRIIGYTKIYAVLLDSLINIYIKLELNKMFQI